MKRASTIAAVLLVACVAFGRPQLKKNTMTMGAATTKTNSFSDVEGYIDEIEVYVTDGVSTGTVTITGQPADSEASTVAAYNIATNAVTDSQRWRPAVDRTDVAAADLTSDPPDRRLLIGDTIKFLVSGSPTGKVWKIRIKYDDGR